MIALFAKGNTLLAGTSLISVWRYNLSVLGVEDSEADETATTNLFCYPNPASTSITIDRTKLAFNDRSPVRYTISTLTGNKLMEFEKNETTFSITSESLANGVYYVIATQGTNRATSVLTVLR